MRYNIKYSQKGGSAFINADPEFVYISDDLLSNILKYIDFEYCFNLIKLIENYKHFNKKIVNYKHFNKKIFWLNNKYETKYPNNYNNSFCDGLSDEKRNECLKFVFNCENNYTISHRIKNKYTINSVAFNYNDKKIVSGSTKKKNGQESIHIWDVDTGICLLEFKDTPNTTLSVTFSNDDNKVVSASSDGTVRIWNSNNGTIILILGQVKNLDSLIGHTSSVLSVKISNDDKKIISGSRDKTIRVWDFNNGNLLHTLKDHIDSVLSVGFNQNCTKIVSGSEDKTIKIWDFNEDSENYTKCILTLDNKNSVYSVEFNHDSAKIASTSADNIFIWNSETGDLLKKIEPSYSYGGFSCVKFNNNSTLIFAGSYSNKIGILKIETGETIFSSSREEQITSIDISNDNTHFICGTGDPYSKFSRGDELNIFKNEFSNNSSYKLLKSFPHIHTNRITTVAFNNNSSKIVSGSFDNSICIWDVNTSKLLLKLDIPNNVTVLSVEFNYDDSKIVGACTDNTVKIWNSSTGELLKTLIGHTNWVNFAKFNNDASIIVSGSDDRKVIVWDFDTRSGSYGNPIFKFKHIDKISSIDFSHDSKKIISASSYIDPYNDEEDYQICVWNVDKLNENFGEKIKEFKTNINGIESIKFNHDSTKIIIGLYNYIKILDINTGEFLNEIEINGNGMYIDINYNSTMIVSGIGSRIMIWDLLTGKLLIRIIDYDFISSIDKTVVKFNHDGTQILGASNNIIKIWKLL
jgi:WD40 repeat protein